MDLHGRHRGRLHAQPSNCRHRQRHDNDDVLDADEGDAADVNVGKAFLSHD
mgnify:CR=1 FL=1